MQRFNGNWNTIARPVQHTSHTAPASDGKVMTARFSGRCATCGGWIVGADRSATPDTIRFNGKAHHYPTCTQEVKPDPMEGWDEQAQTWGEDRMSDRSIAREMDNDVAQLIADAAKPQLETAPVAPASEPREGTFTVVLANGERRTLKIRRQPADRDFMPGKLIVSYLSGSDNESAYTRFAHISDGRLFTWKRFKQESVLVLAANVLLDPESAANAGLAYAMESGRCCICGRKLTVPASISMGMGPECASRN